MSSICLFLSEILGARRGGVATYTISGTINDSAGAGLDGVTITLTGDASDSTTTAGGGAYSFSGLVDGSYTVTPTKSGSTFSPTSDAVTVSGGNATADTMAQVWQITGTINDDDGAGYDGVTVTLSGDASDSDTTAGGGAYAFTGLSDGSYTVTPTKGGSTFSPASDNVSVSGADAVATTMSESWSISGTVSDYASAAVSGVTLTLSGDASDSTSSAANGTYSFTGLSNGSYTVTPTLSGREFNPSSTNVTVSGANQTGKDFTRYLALPYTYDVSTEVSETSGAIAGQLSDWTIWPTFSDGIISTSDLADTGSSFTPSGVTKRFGISYNGGQDVIINDLPDVIDSSITSIRLAFLVWSDAADEDISMFLTDLSASEIVSDASAERSRCGIYIRTDVSKDDLTSYSKYNSATLRKEWDAADTGYDYPTNYWHWVRIEYDFDNDQLYAAQVSAASDFVNFTDTVAMHADGQALSNLTNCLKAAVVQTLHGADDVRFARYWIGRGSDAWPSVAP